MIHNHLRSRMAWVTILAYVLTFVMAPTASAGMIGTNVQLARVTHAAKVADVRQLLSQKRVEKQMIALGVDPATAQLRVANLTNQQLDRIQGRLESLPAGAGLIWIAGVVFVVLIILELVGVINIFR